MILDTALQAMAAQSFAVVEPQAEGQFLATFLGWPQLQAQGYSRQEALEKLSQLVQQRFKQAEILPLKLDLPTALPPHPWAKFAGMFAEDVQFDAVMDEIHAYRQELDEADEDGLV